MKELLDDLSRTFIIHDDLRPANIMRAPADSHWCRRHCRVHEWNLVDFAWAGVDDPSTDAVHKRRLYKHQMVGYHGPRWYGEYF